MASAKRCAGVAIPNLGSLLFGPICDPENAPTTCPADAKCRQATHDFCPPHLSECVQVAVPKVHVCQGGNQSDPSVKCAFRRQSLKEQD